MGDVKLTSPRVRVLREGHEPIEVQTDNRDLVLWEKTRVKHRWPAFNEAPIIWLTFISWAASRRTGAIPPEYKYELWESETLDVSSLDDDDTTGEQGSPFDPEPEPDSLSSSP